MIAKTKSINGQVYEWLNGSRNVLEKMMMFSFIIFPYIQNLMERYTPSPLGQNYPIPFIISGLGVLLIGFSIWNNNPLVKKVFVATVFLYSFAFLHVAYVNEFHMITILGYFVTIILASASMNRFRYLVSFNIFNFLIFFFAIVIGGYSLTASKDLIIGCFILCLYSITTYAYFIQRERELEKQKEEILASKNELQFLMDSISVMISYKDDKNQVIKMNRAQEDMVPFRNENGKPVNLYDHLPAEQAKLFHERDLEIIKTGKPLRNFVGEYENEHGELKYFRTDIYPYKGDKENRKSVVVMGIDVTKEENYKKELEEKKRVLELSNEELETFAYAVSHDLKEPLRMITGYMQLLEKRYSEKLDGDAKEFIEFAVDGATRMNGLIEGILEFSRVGRFSVNVSKTEVDLNKTCERILFDLQLLIKEKNAKISIGNLPRLSINSTEMQALFSNLIGNALKYSRNDIDVEINISCEKKKNKFIFKVQDNGIGMEEEHKELIFSLFQRLHTRGEFEGSGIGLSICKKIIEMNKGRIWVETIKGEGSTFFFTLPRSIGVIASATDNRKSATNTQSI